MEKMKFDFSKLKGRIIEKYETQGNFAGAMGWSERTMSLKMTGEVPWSQQDIIRATELLDIPVEEIHAYFFTIKVQNLEPKAGEEI